MPELLIGQKQTEEPAIVTTENLTTPQEALIRLIGEHNELSEIVMKMNKFDNEVAERMNSVIMGVNRVIDEVKALKGRVDKLELPELPESPDGPKI